MSVVASAVINRYVHKQVPQELMDKIPIATFVCMNNATGDASGGGISFQFKGKPAGVKRIEYYVIKRIFIVSNDSTASQFVHIFCDDAEWEQLTPLSTVSFMDMFKAPLHCGAYTSLPTSEQIKEPIYLGKPTDAEEAELVVMLSTNTDTKLYGVMLYGEIYAAPPLHLL